MGSSTPPFQATISAIALDLGGHSTPGTINVPGYLGEPLFYHVASAGGTLTITVDRHSPSVTSAPTAATNLQVVVDIGNGAARSAPVGAIVYAPGTVLHMKVMVTSNLSDVTLQFSDRTAARNTETGTELKFVLVQEASLKEPRYRLEWIVDSIWIEDAAYRSSASVVEPVPDVAGGAMGPMGLATP